MPQPLDSHRFGAPNRWSQNSAAAIALATLEPFEGCAPAAIEWASRDAEIVDLSAGSRLDTAGARARQFVVVLDGIVFGVGNDGTSVMLHAGDSYGAYEITSLSPHTRTYIALTPAQVVIVFGPVFAAIARRPRGLAAAVSATRAPSADLRRPARARGDEVDSSTARLLDRRPAPELPT